MLLLWILKWYPWFAGPPGDFNQFSMDFFEFIYIYIYHIVYCFKLLMDIKIKNIIIY